MRGKTNWLRLASLAVVASCAVMFLISVTVGGWRWTMSSATALAASPVTALDHATGSWKAYREFDPNNGYDVTYYGKAIGTKTLEFEIGPHYDSQIFNIYENQDTALLALKKGDIDYLFNPLGLKKGLEKIVNSAPDLELITNPASNIRYLGFNVRKAPMDSKAFRQAVALVIDKEFVAEQVLQGAAIPAYAMVPEGNTFWHNTNVPKIGKGLDRSERVAEAVRILKAAGFTYEIEPQVSEDGAFLTTTDAMYVSVGLSILGQLPVGVEQ